MCLNSHTRRVSGANYQLFRGNPSSALTMMLSGGTNQIRIERSNRIRPRVDTSETCHELPWAPGRLNKQTPWIFVSRFPSSLQSRVSAYTFGTSFDAMRLNSASGEGNIMSEYKASSCKMGEKSPVCFVVRSFRNCPV